MNTIDREELKTKLERGDNFRLIMTLNDEAYNLMHIPGSLHFGNVFEAMTQLSADDEIIVYSSNKWCHFSFIAYLVLRNYGFKKLRRYTGGLMDWLEASYPLEGSVV